MAKRTAPHPDDDPVAEAVLDDELMTIEELADRSGIAPRTIRFYQGEKLLQKPERDRTDGRVWRRVGFQRLRDRLAHRSLVELLFGARGHFRPL